MSRKFPAVVSIGAVFSLALTGAAPAPSPSTDTSDIAQALHAAGVQAPPDESQVLMADAAMPETSGPVTGDGDFGDVTIDFPGSEQIPSEVDGMAIYEVPAEGYSTAVVNQTDGIQIATVIDGPEGPTMFDYAFEGADEFVLLDDGSYSVYDQTGALIGVIGAAWATDANGQAVPTEYIVNGNVLTQVVTHGSEFAYPIVADPTYTNDVLTSAFMSDYSAANPGRKLRVTISTLGRQILGDSGDLTAGWNILVSDFGHYMPVGVVRDSMRQQWDCHELGHVFEPGTFDLETGRGSYPNWITRIPGSIWQPALVCNW